MVYLIHLDKLYQRRRHYIGADDPIGAGAEWLERARAAGIGWRTARVWPGGKRNLVRRLRALANHASAAYLCPVCSGQAAYNRAVPRKKRKAVKIAISQRDQARLCLSCPLPRCLGVESPRCPIRIEQRQRWREHDKRRRPPGYRKAAEQKAKASESGNSRRPADDQPPEWRPLEQDQSTTP